ncbi:MAG: sigma-70 family RNA polymerase sigma factor [Bacteroidota bacterium]|nr:sigma-70 family RNA polymerase sigma factor [Bacteroidota bacterium]MDP4216616.1 sigma-70 family RNA polymerase sigma factor [Bacteroidota bacterium]MDP4245265.1 sigma-70 family RNA polymerase sigma factor [Bacteroidota bacterium]MDP4253934.1 sigma-70 family RNA polymerase sigma factor [Bacteroidota bacterium]MDP4259422.1 sigma-70 family RNA polymerase sigma factor [Bacteroidota bacterium]
MTENEQQHLFETWLREYRAIIFKIVRAYAFTAMDQDDLFQEIVIQIWHSIPAFRSEASPTTWIYRLSLNIAIKWVRRERRHYAPGPLEDAGHLLHENPVDERLRWLYQEIHQLNEVDRSIALLLLDGFSYKEMAHIIGITESNIGVRINRIKKHLVTKSKKEDYHGT